MFPPKRLEETVETLYLLDEVRGELVSRIAVGDAIRSVRMLLATIGQTITHAQAEYEAKYARRKTAEEAAAQPASAEAPPVLAAEALALPAEQAALQP